MESFSKPASGKRGRPAGSGEINDAPSLARMADLIHADAGLAPMTAIKRACGPVNESALRRLYRKWQVRHAQLLAEARGRAERLTSQRQMDAITEAAASARLIGAEFAELSRRVAMSFAPIQQQMLDGMAKLEKDFRINPELKVALQTPPVLPPELFANLEKLQEVTFRPEFQAAVERLSSFKINPELQAVVERLSKLSVPPLPKLP